MHLFREMFLIEKALNSKIWRLKLEAGKLDLEVLDLKIFKFINFKRG